MPTLRMLALGLVLFAVACTEPDEADRPEAPAADKAGAWIQPYPENPRYWQFQGEPVVLLGGSKEDNLFQIADLAAHLDELAAVGGNYVRNTMSSRDAGNLWPFERGPDGLYDLDRLNPAYFDRFETLLELAAERGIVVQIELWDRFDFAREPWQANPYRPANNSTYTPEESGLANDYPRHPGNNDNPFFYAVPALQNNELLLAYQQAQVDRLLAISLRYPNVLYTMDNETSGAEAWGAYWAEYIQEQADALGVQVYTTEMWDAWDLKDEEHRRTLDHPERYAFADISQNNHNADQEHWDNLQWVRAYTADRPRPLNHVKIYGADTGRYGTDRDGVERFWRSLVGGAASVRFHRPPAGLGLGVRAQSHIRSGRMWTEAFDVIRAVPDADSQRLAEREPDEAYATVVPGEQVSVYFPDGGAVRLDLRDLTGSLTLRWLDAAGSTWQDGGPVAGGDWVSLTAPAGGHWVAVLTVE